MEHIGCFAAAKRGERGGHIYYPLSHTHKMSSSKLEKKRNEVETNILRYCEGFRDPDDDQLDLATIEIDSKNPTDEKILSINLNPPNSTNSAPLQMSGLEAKLPLGADMTLVRYTL